MFLSDTLTLDSPRRDSAGNLVASVLAARTGIQDYAGYEVGKPEMARVRVYRPAEEVFSRDSMKSFAGAPVTIEHPREQVTPANWKDHAVGEASEEIVRDGEAVRVPFLLRDADGIKAVEGGKREISMGYTCDLDWTSGRTSDGQAYDAVQRGIRINHLAIVDKARGGPSLRIGDSEMTTKTITFDGLPLLVTDAAEAAIGKLQAIITDAQGRVVTLEAKTVADAATIVAKDAEITRLTADLASAKITPAQMRDAGKAYAVIVGKAKASGVTVTDEMDEGAIMKAVVDKAMPGNTYAGDHVAIAFEALTKDAKIDPLRDALTQQPIVDGMDPDADRAKRKAAISDAWRQPANTNAA